MRRWWGKMASTSWTPWRLPRHPRRSGSCRSWRACVGHGSATTSGRWTRQERQGEVPSAACGSRRTGNYRQPPKSIESPYDADARYRHKRDTAWTGYMVHVSETCEPTAPHLLTHVHTTPATVHEAQCTTPIQQALMDKELPPREHFVDAAYISADLLVHSRDEQGITLRGPTRPSPGLADAGRGSLYVRAVHGGLGAAAGALSAGQTVGELGRSASAPAGHPFIQCVSARRTAAPVPPRPLCTHAKPAAGARRSDCHPGRSTRRLHAAQAWYASEEGNGAISGALASKGRSPRGCARLGCGARGIGGLPKTHLQHVATAAAINIDRIVAWLDERPRAQTRTSRFAALAPVYVLHPGEAAA